MQVIMYKIKDLIDLIERAIDHDITDLPHETINNIYLATQVIHGTPRIFQDQELANKHAEETHMLLIN